MAFAVADAVRETSAFAGGTGAINLPVVPYSSAQTFLAGWGASGTGWYTLVQGGAREVGFGTLNAGGTTLTRTTVLWSTNASALVSFAAGSVDCFGDIPADVLKFLNHTEITVTCAATTDIGAVAGAKILISGATGPVTSLGTTANRIKFVRFDAAPTLTHNVTSLILPGAANIVAAAGDTAIFASDASGNWRCLNYQRAARYTARDDISIHGADIASATGAGTLNLETATGIVVDVTGTTTITAVTLSDGHERIVRFTGALVLTNGASLVLPGAANITTAAGDFAVFRGYAAGVVRVQSYQRAAGAELLTAQLAIASETTLTTATGKTVISKSLTPGDWDVWGVITFESDTTTVVQYVRAAISAVDNTMPAVDAAATSSVNWASGTVLGGVYTHVATPAVPVSITAATTYYLVGISAFGTSFVKAAGTIVARRRGR